MEENITSIGNNENDDLQAELRVLHSQLDASSSDYGDYNMSKAIEKLIEGISQSDDVVDALNRWADNEYVNLQKKIDKRKEIRERIIEIENELNTLDDCTDFTSVNKDKQQ